MSLSCLTKRSTTKRANRALKDISNVNIARKETTSALSKQKNLKVGQSKKLAQLSAPKKSVPIENQLTAFSAPDDETSATGSGEGSIGTLQSLGLIYLTLMGENDIDDDEEYGQAIKGGSSITQPEEDSFGALIYHRNYKSSHVKLD
jgi:hypothetical protein